MQKLTSTLFLALLFTFSFTALPACSSTYETVADEVDDFEDVITGDNMVAVDSGFVSVNGAEIFYREAGQGMPMVLIHGYPFSSQLFSKNMAALSENHRVIAVTLRGYGKSTAPGNNSDARIDTYAEDVLDVMNEMGIDEAIVGGMSMGGPIALEMYEMAPERFMGLLLIDTNARAATPAEKHLWLGVSQMIEEGGMAAIIPVLMKDMYTGETRMENQRLIRTSENIIKNASKQAGLSGAMALAEREDYRSTLRDVTVPTLIIVGLADTLYPFELARKMQNKVAGSELVIIPEASHAAIIERANAANDAIIDWLMDSPQLAGDL